MSTRPSARYLVDAHGRRIGVVLPMEEFERLSSAERLPSRPVHRRKRRAYDFSDLAGRLHWQGDALTEQRAIRAEW